MKTIHPDMETLPEILANIPLDTPVVMVNLLKFRDSAQGKDLSVACSGRKAYGLYAEALIKILPAHHAEVMYLGSVCGSIIGPTDETWDEVLLVRYPSIQAFIGMVESPEYKAVVKYRTAALEDSRLIATLAARSFNDQ